MSARDTLVEAYAQYHLKNVQAKAEAKLTLEEEGKEFKIGQVVAHALLREVEKEAVKNYLIFELQKQGSGKVIDV